MPLALDTQQTTQIEDTQYDVEVWPLALDSQSHKTTPSYMSDTDLCSRDMQHDSVMHLCDAAISACVHAEMDNDPLGLLQSQSPPRARRSRRARSSPPVRRRVRLVSCERGETLDTPRTPSPIGRVPPPPRRDPDEESRPQSPRHRVPPPPPPPQHAAQGEPPPIEKQMPIPVAKRAIAPQPPPPPPGRVPQAQRAPEPAVTKQAAIQPIPAKQQSAARPREAEHQRKRATQPNTIPVSVQPKETASSCPTATRAADHQRGVGVPRKFCTIPFGPFGSSGSSSEVGPDGDEDSSCYHMDFPHFREVSSEERRNP
eukprot:1272450-Amphidinium_carterae.1